MPRLEPHSMWMDCDPADDSLGQWVAGRQSRIWTPRPWITSRRLARLSRSLLFRLPLRLRWRRPTL